MKESFHKSRSGNKVKNFWYGEMRKKCNSRRLTKRVSEQKSLDFLTAKHHTSFKSFIPTTNQRHTPKFLKYKLPVLEPNFAPGPKFKDVLSVFLKNL